MKQHRFISKQEGSIYSRIVYCSYCGHVAFDGNNSNDRDKHQKIAREECPLGKEETIKA